MDRVHSSIIYNSKKKEEKDDVNICHSDRRDAEQSLGC